MLFALTAFIAYAADFHDPLSLTFKKIYPAVVVRERLISIYELDKAFEIARSLDSTVSKKTVIDQLISAKKMESLVRKLRVDYDSGKITDEFLFFKTNNNDEYIKLVKDHFSGQEKLFEKFVVEPEALSAALKIRFNSNFEMNSNAFNRIKDIQRQLNEGRSFEDLAREKSDDKLTGQFGGDLGFVQEHEIIPELFNKIDQAQIGAVLDQIVVSRFGYHLLYPVESNGQGEAKVWQVKHILVETSGFDQWFEHQTQNLPVWKIVK